MSANTTTATLSRSDWSSYATVPADFSKNPPAYIGTKVKVGGSVIDFLAANDRGGTSNFVEILATSNEATLNGEKFMLEIDDANNYAAAAKVLNKVFTSSNFDSSGIIAYGAIEASQVFTNANGGDSYMPVIKVDRLDTCGVLICSAIPSSYNTSTIFPAGITPSISQTSTPTTSIQSTFTTPSGATIDANGNVISAPPVTPADDKTLGINYYITNKTCGGLTNQNQYSYCIQYAYNPTPIAPSVTSTPQGDDPNVLATLKQNASTKWGDNYTMVQYEYNQQVTAYEWVLAQTQYPDIMTKAKQKWNDDYVMAQYEYNQQVAAYKALGNQ
jgi:hypothetical protein